MATAIIDCDFDSEAADDTTSGSEVATTVRVADEVEAGSVDYRTQLRFPLTSISASAVTDSDLQFNVTAENVEAGEGVSIHPYNDTGDDDPDADSIADKFTRSTSATTFTTLIDCSSTGSKTGDLGTTADSIILGNLTSPGFISLGVRNSGVTIDTGETVSIEAIENAGTDPATLTVVYTEAAAGAVGLMMMMGVGT